MVVHVLICNRRAHITLDGSCRAAAEHGELTICTVWWSLHFTQDRTGWGFDPGLVPSSAGENQNISLIALIVPLHRTMWQVTVRFSCGFCSSAHTVVHTKSEEAWVWIALQLAWCRDTVSRTINILWAHNNYLSVNTHSRQLALIGYWAQHEHSRCPWQRHPMSICCPGSLQSDGKCQPPCWKWLKLDLAKLLSFYFLEFYTVTCQ